MTINNMKFFIKYKNAILKMFLFINFSSFEILINILLIIYKFVIIFNYLFRFLLLIYLLIFFLLLKI